MQQLIENYCMRDDLTTDDPYDVWKTSMGLATKGLFYRHRTTAFLPAGALALFDNFLNNRLRLFYAPQEYPIVRALAALTLLNLYERDHNRQYLECAEKHLAWLAENACPGHKGTGWGLGFSHPVSAEITYDANTPLSTVTPYVLEAYVRHMELTSDDRYIELVRRIHTFYQEDIEVLHQTDEYLATSYGPKRDRIVTNAVAYTMYSYCLLLPLLHSSARPSAKRRIEKLYAYVRDTQRTDGSWLYSPEGEPFIDCFHSCLVLKNLLKTDHRTVLAGCAEVVGRGYRYIKGNFWDGRKGLCRRFSVQHMPSLVSFDLYDNAEALNLAVLMGDKQFARQLAGPIQKHFHKGASIYSRIDSVGVKRNRNTLRWAVMPYLCALSEGIKSDVF